METTYTGKQPDPYDMDDRDELYQTRLPTSTRRYKTSEVDSRDELYQTRPHTSARSHKTSDVTDRDELYQTRPHTSTRRYKTSDVTDRDELYQTRPHTSARRYKPHDTLDDPIVQQATLVQRRRSSLQPQPRRTNGVASNAVTSSHRTVRYEEEEVPLRRVPNRPKRSFTTTLTIGMVITVVLLIGVAFLSSWWQGFQDDVHYGYPRTSHLDAVVGHGDSPSNRTHFIFINLHGHIQVIEIPGGDPAHTRIYTGPTLYGSGQDRIPVTGEIVKDQGKANLLVHVGSQEFLFINDGTTFHPK